MCGWILFTIFLIKNYFTFNHQIYGRVTKQSGKLQLPKVKTEIAKQSFYYTGCVAFNKLYD